MARNELSTQVSLGSVVGTRITTRHQDLHDLLVKRIVRRQVRYSDFIAESARLLVDALEHNASDPQKLTNRKKMIFTSTSPQQQASPPR